MAFCWQLVMVVYSGIVIYFADGSYPPRHPLLSSNVQLVEYYLLHIERNPGSTP